MSNWVYVPLMAKNGLSLYVRAKIDKQSPQVEEGHGFHVVDDGLSIELDSLELFVKDFENPISILELLNKDQVSYIEKLIIEKL